MTDIDDFDQAVVDNDPTLQVAQIGIELATSRGLNHLLKQLRAEAQAALSDLVDVDPADAKRIAALQEIVKRHRDLARLVLEAVAAGKSAERQIEQNDSN